jgi:hypothetical protein
VARSNERTDGEIIVLTVAGILVLVAGIVFPMAMLFWLNSRLSRKPSLSAGQVGLALAFNGVLPVAMIMLGIGLIAPHLWETVWLPPVTVAAWLAAVSIAVMLAVAGVRNRERAASQPGADTERSTYG